MLSDKQIIERVQLRLDAEDGWKLMAEQDAAYGWEGIRWAAQGKPVTVCWNPVQVQAYKAWQQDAALYGSDEEAMDMALAALRSGVVEPIVRLTDEQMEEMERELWGE